MTGQNSQRNRHVEWGGSSQTACPSKKRAYPTRKNAKHHAKNLREQGAHVRPYECPACSFWHVGHLPNVTQRGEMSSQDFHARRVRYDERTRPRALGDY